MLKCPNECDEGFFAVFERKANMPVLPDDLTVKYGDVMERFRILKVSEASPYIECGGCGFRFNDEVNVVP